MTLILVIPYKDGVVLASDGQVTMGLVKTRAKKIKKFNENCIMGSAGNNLSFIQVVEEALINLSDKEKKLSDLRNSLCEVIKNCLEKMPPSPREPYSASFTFVEHRENITYLLNIRENGISVMLENVPFATGIGEQFAYALIQKYQDLLPDKIDGKRAAVLAYKIISETIETITIGVGPPIDIWTLPPIKNLSREEITAVEETYLMLKKAEIEMLLKID